MDKPLELYVSAPTNDTSDPMHVTLPFQVNVLVISNDIYMLDWLTVHLDSCENLKWTAKSYLSELETDIKDLPSVVIISLPNEEQEAIKALDFGQNIGCDMILVGADTSPTVLRQAFQYNVTDFITRDSLTTELNKSLLKVSRKLSEQAKLAPVLAIVNGKAGSGASFIAASLADIVSRREEVRVSVLDTDLHQGTLAHILGLEPKYSICDVLSSLDEFDEVALKSTMVTRGNLSLLAAKPFELLGLHQEVDITRNKELLFKCRQYYDQIIMDFSRGPEYWNGDLLLNATILVVTQQNIMHLRQTKDLVQQLTNRIGVPEESIGLIINRYDKRSDISIEDVKATIGISSVYTIANDYKLSSESVELGKPICELASKQAMFQDLQHIANQVIPVSDTGEKNSSGFWKRLLGK